MGKRFLTILAVAGLICSVALLGLSGAAEQKAAEVMDIQAKLWSKHTKGPVNF